MMLLLSKTVFTEEALGTSICFTLPMPSPLKRKNMAADIGENKCIVLQSRPGVDNAPTESNFALKTIEVPRCDEGQIVVKTLYLSVDPYMRCRMNEDTGSGYLTPWPLGQPLSGCGVGKVVQSRSEKFREGDIVHSFEWSWQEFVVFSEENRYIIKVLFVKVSLPGYTKTVSLNLKNCSRELLTNCPSRETRGIFYYL